MLPDFSAVHAEYPQVLPDFAAVHAEYLQILPDFPAVHAENPKKYNMGIKNIIEAWHRTTMVLAGILQGVQPGVLQGVQPGVLHQVLPKFAAVLPEYQLSN